MSDQLFRLWEKLQIELPEDAVPYFKPKHIALLQWFWQSRQLQSASEDSAFVQQCLKEQVERVASARVDIMVEAEQLGFDLPTAEPTLDAFCHAVIWWGQQSGWRSWLNEIEDELVQFGYSGVRPSPNYAPKEIEGIRSWLLEQRNRHAQVIELQDIAQQLSYDLPSFNTPYQTQEIAQLEQILNARAELWSHFDSIESEAAEYGWTLSIEADERTHEQLKVVRETLEQQMEWRLQLLSLNEKLSAVQAKPIAVSMPLELRMVEDAQKQLDFHESCERIIAANQRKWLLPWYRNKVDIPSPPFDEASFEQYQNDFKPYLVRSMIWLWLVAIMGTLSLIGSFI